MDEHYRWIPSIEIWCLMFASVTKWMIQYIQNQNNYVQLTFRLII